MRINIILLSIVSFLSISNDSLAQTWIPVSSKTQREPVAMKILKDEASSYQMEVNINGLLDQQVDIKQGIFHRISLGMYGTLMNSGEPLLPMISRLIAIPDGTVAKSSIVEEQWTDVEIGSILPAQIPPKSSKQTSSFYKNEKSYANPFIPTIVNQSEEQKWCNIRNVLISICPFKYYPKENRLSVLSKFILNVDFIPTEDLTKESLSYKGHRDYAQFDNTVFSLPSRTQNTTLSNNTYLIIVGDIPGIIGSRQLKEFMRWKALKGFDTKVVSLSSILSTSYYSQDEVKEYIRDEVGSGGFVLLVGDNSKIPMASIPSFYYNYQTIYGDYWYGCDTGTNVWEADIAIGRFSITSLGEFEYMARKTINYESTEPQTMNTLLVAHKENPTGNYGYQHWCEWINNTPYVEPMSFVTAYGAEGATNADVVSYINSGVPIVCYLGYGFPNYWGGLGANYGQPDPYGGWNIDGESFYSTAVSSLNDTARAVIFSGASNTANISVSGNMLEAFTRYYYGVPAFVGSAIDGLNFDEYNEVYSKIVFEYLLCTGDYLLADLTNKAHISCVTYESNNSLAKDHSFSYINGGDPALELWTANPQSFGRVGLTEGGNSITITTQQYTGNYNVCVASEDGNLIGVYPVSSSNTCTFPRPTGNFYISIIKHNYIPHIIKYDVYTDAIQNETIFIDSYYHYTPIGFGDGVSLDIPDGPVILKSGTKLIIQNGAGGVLFIEGFKCEKGGIMEVK